MLAAIIATSCIWLYGTVNFYPTELLISLFLNSVFLHFFPPIWTPLVASITETQADTRYAYHTLPSDCLCQEILLV